MQAGEYETIWVKQKHTSFLISILFTCIAAWIESKIVYQKTTAKSTIQIHQIC